MWPLNWESHFQSFFSVFSAGADQNVKNDKGESPYDTAVKGGYENLVKKFAAQMGQSQLDKMIRPKSKGYWRYVGNHPAYNENVKEKN